MLRTHVWSCENQTSKFWRSWRKRKNWWNFEGSFGWEILLSSLKSFILLTGGKMGAAASTNPQWQSRSEKPSRQLFGGSSGGDYILFWETVESELMVFDIPNWTTMRMKNGWLERRQTEPPTEPFFAWRIHPRAAFRIGGCPEMRRQVQKRGLFLLAL